MMHLLLVMFPFSQGKEISQRSTGNDCAVNEEYVERCIAISEQRLQDRIAGTEDANQFQVGNHYYDYLFRNMSILCFSLATVL